MRARSILVALVIALVVSAAAAGASPFAYRADTPLDARTESTRVEKGVRIVELTYASPKGGRVPAVVVAPLRGRPPYAGMLVQHGLPSTKESMVPVAVDLAKLGAVVIAVDAPFNRRAGEVVAFTRRDRAEQIQLIVDLRRAVDLLRARPDVDDDRIGYLGYSYGGAMGGLLAGAEHRLRAFVLMVGDGGLVEHFTGPEDAGGPLASIPARRRAQWIAAMKPVEPLTWVKRSTTPLLFLSGRFDPLVPPRDARRYHRAAPEPKEVRWYDSDHSLPDAAWCYAARFLERRIAIAGGKHPRC